jgi:hypothetical protein
VTPAICVSALLPIGSNAAEKLSMIVCVRGPPNARSLLCSNEISKSHNKSERISLCKSFQDFQPRSDRHLAEQFWNGPLGDGS